MKARLFAAALICLVMAADDEPPPDDMKLIQGTWTLTNMEVNGTPLGDAVANLRRKLVVKNNTMVLTRETAETGTAGPEKEKEAPAKITFTIDQTKTPKTIDTTTVRKDGTTVELGIYQLDGDTLTVCTAKPGDPRPADLKTADGDGKRKFLFSRVKEKAK